MTTFVIIIAVVAAAVTITFDSANAKAPNSPNYYNRNECWNNDGERFHYIDSPTDISIHIREESNKSSASSPSNTAQQEGRFFSEEQRKSIAEKWSKGVTMMSTMIRSLGVEKLLYGLSLPCDVNIFSEEVKRLLCAEGMKFVEQMSVNSKPVDTRIIKELFKRHNYDGKPKNVRRSPHPINCIFCPPKFIFGNDENGLGIVLDSYIDGFYYSQSAQVEDRLYLLVNGDNDELIPVVEINHIKLVNGSKISDIARLFNPQK